MDNLGENPDPRDELDRAFRCVEMIGVLALLAAAAQKTGAWWLIFLALPLLFAASAYITVTLIGWIPTPKKHLTVDPVWGRRIRHYVPPILAVLSLAFVVALVVKLTTVISAVM